MVVSSIELYIGNDGTRDHNLVVFGKRTPEQFVVIVLEQI